MITQTEENYLKTILNLSLETNSKISTNAIAEELGTSAASVSDMLKKLEEKKQNHSNTLTFQFMGLPM